MFTNAENPKWTGKEHRSIVLDVEMNGEWVKYPASPTDCDELGLTLYHFAANGIFGPIADSDEERILNGELPVPEGYGIQDGRLINIAIYEEQAIEELNRRLSALQTPEVIARAEIDEEYAAERRAKIAAVLAVKDQPGWPINITWPAE